MQMFHKAFRKRPVLTSFLMLVIAVECVAIGKAIADTRYEHAGASLGSWSYPTRTSDPWYPGYDVCKYERGPDSCVGGLIGTETWAKDCYTVANGRESTKKTTIRTTAPQCPSEWRVPQIDQPPYVLGAYDLPRQ